jgi:hypothetical protein
MGYVRLACSTEYGCRTQGLIDKGMPRKGYRSAECEGGCVCGRSANIHRGKNERSNRIKRKYEKERRGGIYTTSAERGACTRSRHHLEGACALALAPCDTYTHTPLRRPSDWCAYVYSGGGANPGPVRNPHPSPPPPTRARPHQVIFKSRCARTVSSHW